MRRMLNKLLIRLGHELIKKSTNPDPFVVKNTLLNGSASVIFDVGAHSGAVANLYRRYFPTARIHCFEPYPKSFELLKENLASDPGVNCHSLALSDETGSAVFHGNSSTATNSLLPTDSSGHFYWGEGLLETTGTQVVKTMTVDDFMSSHSLQTIDILKLDVQGAEFRVLSGASRALAAHQIRLVYFEMIFCPTYQGQRAFSEYLLMLEKHGYRFLDFYNGIRKHNQLIQADVIFVNAAMSDLIVLA
jgi:FkbM family methyltransferase